MNACRFLELSSEIFCVLNSSGRILETNKACTQILGWSEEEFLQKNLFDLVNPDEIAVVESEFSLALQPGYQANFSHDTWTKFSERVRLSWQISFSEEDQLFYACARDITSQREQVLRSTQRYRALIESSPDFILTVNREGKILFASRIKVGFTWDDLYKCTILDFVPPEQHGVMKDCLRRTFEERITTSYESTAVDSNGVSAGWFLSRLTPVISDNQVIEAMLAIIDITERKKLEQQIEDQRLKMIHAAKMSSLGEMAGGIAHEINNPLAIIHLKASRLLLQLKGREIDEVSFREDLASILSTTMRISKIIRGLRNFSRTAETDPFEKCWLRPIVEDTLELCAERFKNSGISIVIDHLPEIQFSCRPTQVSQILLNLLNNAFDAVGELKERWVHLHFERMASVMRIYVTDSGQGISPEVADKMMLPFFSTKDVGGGTGLGLSISKSLIESHGGQFWYDAAHRHTRFVVELPLCPP